MIGTPRFPIRTAISTHTSITGELWQLSLSLALRLQGEPPPPFEASAPRWSEVPRTDVRCYQARMLELFDCVGTRLPGRRSRPRPLGTCRLKQREVLNKMRDKYARSYASAPISLSAAPLLNSSF